MRCFVAIELSPELRSPLVRLLRQLPRASGARWVTEDQLHVTLKFLGEVNEAQLPAVCEAIRTASSQVEPFRARLGPLGGFPSPRSPRVLWCGFDDPGGHCARWVELADPLLAELGFAAEARAFTPHITLGRSKSPDGTAALREVLEKTAAPQAGEMLAQQVTLFESRLSPQGAQYTPVCRAALGADQERS